MSKVIELLNEYRVALDRTGERLAETRDLSIRNEIYELVERTVPGFLTALLEDLGHDIKPGTSVEGLITQASIAVEERRDRFSKDAPVGFFAKRIQGLKQVLRDTGYLREGFGRANKPADMKWVARGAVEGYLVDLMSYVASELKTDGAEVRRLKPESHLDFAAVQRGIVDLVRQNLDAGRFMDAATDLGVSQTDPAGWESFGDLPYETEIEARSDFLVNVITANPPSKPIAGFFFEIAHPSREGETVADLWLSGASHYEPDVDEWFADLNYTPSSGKLGSEVLASIYQRAYLPGGLGNAAEYTLCLAWSAFFARECTRRYVDVMQTGRVGCRVGFSGGDWIELGWIGPNLVATK